MNEQKRTAKETAIYEGMLSLAARGEALETVKVERIAQAAGLGKGTLYEYFKSKEEMLAGLADYCVQTELSHIEDVLRQETTFWARAEALLAYLESLIKTRIAAYKTLAQTLQNGDVSKQRENETMQRLKELLHRGIREGKAEGAVEKALSEDYCAFAILSVLSGYGGYICREKGGAETAQMAMASLKKLLYPEK